MVEGAVLDNKQEKRLAKVTRGRKRQDEPLSLTARIVVANAAYWAIGHLREEDQTRIAKRYMLPDNIFTQYHARIGRVTANTHLLAAVGILEFSEKFEWIAQGIQDATKIPAQYADEVTAGTAAVYYLWLMGTHTYRIRRSNRTGEPVRGMGAESFALRRARNILEPSRVVKGINNMTTEIYLDERGTGIGPRF